MVHSFATMVILVFATDFVSGDTTTTPRTTRITTQSPYLNECQQFTTGGCLESHDDDGFLALLTSTNPGSCYRVCYDYGEECNSVVFKPENPNDNGGQGNCTLWRHTVSEYHGNCTTLSGYAGSSRHNCLSNFNDVQSCEVSIKVRFIFSFSKTC